MLNDDLQCESVSKYDRSVLCILFGILTQISGRFDVGFMRLSFRDVEEDSKMKELANCVQIAPNINLHLRQTLRSPPRTAKLRGNRKPRDVQ